MSNQKKIKVLHLITALGTGGAEKVVLDLASQLSPHQFEVHVFAIGTMDDLLPQFQSAGLSVDIAYSKKTPWALYRTFRKIKKQIEEQQIDLIHAHLFHAMVMAACLKRALPTLKVVFTPHSVNMESYLRELLLRWLRPFREKDILFSSQMNRRFRKAGFAIIPNGINVEKYRLELPKEKTFTFLAIGRLSVEKNFSALISAVESIPPSYDFQIWIAGEGAQRKELEVAIARKKRKSEIRLLGNRSDIPQLCNQVHAFLLPSLWEGFPLVLLEAGAAALPVVSTKVGAISELLDDTCGYLRKVDLFAQTMMQIMDDYPKAKEKGERLRQKVEQHFSSQHFIDQHQVLYHEVMGSRFRPEAE